MEDHPSQDILLALLRRELAPEPEKRTLEHLKGCARCRRDYAVWQRIEAALSHLPAVTPRKHVWETIKASVPHAERPAHAFFERLAAQFGKPALAGALALIILASLLIHSLVSRYGNPPEREIGIAEMGSTIARRNLADRDIASELPVYFSDCKRLLDTITDPAQSDTPTAWKEIKKEIISHEMLYRTLYLRDKLPRDHLESCPKEEVASIVGLFDDLEKIFQYINNRSAGQLVKEQDEIIDAVKAAHLCTRLQERGSR
jgi:hypothetical protein